MLSSVRVKIWPSITEIKAKGWEALVKELGYAGATKFILLYEPREGDYTEKRKELLTDLTIDEIIREIENKRKSYF